MPRSQVMGSGGNSSFSPYCSLSWVHPSQGMRLSKIWGGDHHRRTSLPLLTVNDTRGVGGLLAGHPDPNLFSEKSAPRPPQKSVNVC